MPTRKSPTKQADPHAAGSVTLGVDFEGMRMVGNGSEEDSGMGSLRVGASRVVILARGVGRRIEEVVQGYFNI